MFWRFGGIWRWIVLGLAAVGASTVSRTPVLGVVLLSCAAAICFLYRSPKRYPPEAAPIVVSPCDGVINEIKHVENSPCFGGKVIVVSFSNSLFDVHLIRSPVTGKVSDRPLKPDHPEGEESQDPCWSKKIPAILLTDTRGKLLFLSQADDSSWNRAVFACQPGDVVELGAAIGMLPLGCGLKLLFPEESEYNLVVSPGKRIRGGETVIAVRRSSLVDHIVLEES